MCSNYVYVCTGPQCSEIWSFIFWNVRSSDTKSQDMSRFRLQVEVKKPVIFIVGGGPPALSDEEDDDDFFDAVDEQVDEFKVCLPHK